jgi:lysophospholipase L1-like esterase
MFVSQARYEQGNVHRNWNRSADDRALAGTSVGRMPDVLYAALGDGMSGDVHPEADHAQRIGRRVRGLGAASLLHRNNDSVWPEFRGCDLHTRFGRRRWTILAADGANIATVRESQLPLLRGGAEIVTLTVGGNDLLAALGAAESRADFEREAERIQNDLRRLIADVVATGARLVILGTIYDPTDGTGRLPPLGDRLPIDLLDATNEVIRKAAEAHETTALADIQPHFLGHGVASSGDSSLWYSSDTLVEVGYRGASEIRRVWWNVLLERGLVS